MTTDNLAVFPAKSEISTCSFTLVVYVFKNVVLSPLVLVRPTGVFIGSLTVIVAITTGLTATIVTFPIGAVVSIQSTISVIAPSCPFSSSNSKITGQFSVSVWLFSPLGLVTITSVLHPVRVAVTG
jgi:hypothetical protein